MRKMINRIHRAFTRPIEITNNIFLRPQLKNDTVLNRYYKLSDQYSKIFSRFSHIHILERGSDGYSWDSWSGKIRSAFHNKVGIGFLSHPLIAYTMVLAGRGGAVQATRTRIYICKDVLGDEITKKLLLEDYLGLPIISSAEFMTSANRAHHSSHLAYYYKLAGKQFWEANSIVEWGGGYGSMARIVRRLNPNITYIVVDLPELLSLQYIYLGSLEGPENINIISSEGDPIISGKINLISSELLLARRYQIKCETFISTWALTECPEYIQRYVSEMRFFSANEVFIASHLDNNNHLVYLAEEHAVRKLSVPDLDGYHEYWLITTNAEKHNPEREF